MSMDTLRFPASALLGCSLKLFGAGHQSRVLTRGADGGTTSCHIPRNPSTASSASVDSEVSPWGCSQPAGVLHRCLPLLPATQRFLNARIPERGHLCTVDTQPASPVGGYGNLGGGRSRRTPGGVESASDDHCAPPFPVPAPVRAVEHVFLDGGDAVGDVSEASARRTKDVNMVQVGPLYGDSGLRFGSLRTRGRSLLKRTSCEQP